MGSLTYRGMRRTYASDGEPSKVALEMYKSLTDIQTEQAPDEDGWVVPLAQLTRCCAQWDGVV